jgi:hypothetical protein
MQPETYILNAHGKAVLCRNKTRFWKWFERTENRILRKDDLPNGVSVSTVFLGIDHRFSGRGPPILWETMIFGGKHDRYQERYSSRSAALKGHSAALALAKRRVSSTVVFRYARTPNKNRLSLLQISGSNLMIRAAW